MAKLKKPPRRGDVYWVALDPTVGSEIKKTRPAVIVSNNSCHTFGSRVVVLPLTSNVDSVYPGEALSSSRASPLGYWATKSDQWTNRDCGRESTP